MEAELSKVLGVARALERLGWLRPADWVSMGVALLVAGFDDDDIVSLAVLDANATGWDIDGPTRNLFERYSVAEPNPNEATAIVARLLATDLRARPAAVSSPMVRMLAKVAGHYESDLANQALGAEEFLDCDCIATADDAFEAELECLDEIALPDELVQILAASLRGTLPTVQPPRGH